MFVPCGTRSEPDASGRRPLRKRCRRGVAAAEFAILAPFLGALVMGMCEMGRAVMVRDILTNAARKGCRTGVTAGKAYQDVLNDVSDILSDNRIDPSQVTVTVQVASYTGTSTTPSWTAFSTVNNANSFSPKPLDQVQVKVSIPVSQVLWFSPTFLPKTALESETLIMVRQA